MEHKYAVTVSGKQVGIALVRRRGLYYVISCRCHFTVEGIYRLVVTCGPVRENVGILVPDHGDFVLKKELPVKRIGESGLSFILVPKRETNMRIFTPIYPEEPFAYISRVKQTFLVIRDGQPGILMDKMQE